MSEDNRRTNPGLAGSDLSALVQEFYRSFFERVRPQEREAFELRVVAVRNDLKDAGRCGANPALLLHVLVCTKFLRRIPGPAGSDAVRRLTLAQRRTLVGGLRVLQQLGQPWLVEVLGSAQQDWARTLWSGAGLLHQALGREVTIETPAFLWWSGSKPTRRQAERLLTAAIVCLVQELKDHPKPAAAAATLLEKFALLPRGQSRDPVELVSKRARRAAAKALDPLQSVGSLVSSLRHTYESLIDFLRVDSINGLKPGG
jgi:hypothetical protein